MKFFDRLLTIIITATLTSAFWIVFGNTIFEMAEDESAGQTEEVELLEPSEASPSPSPSPTSVPDTAPAASPSAAPAATPASDAPQVIAPNIVDSSPTPQQTDVPVDDVPPVIAPNIVPDAPEPPKPDDGEGGA